MGSPSDTGFESFLATYRKELCWYLRYLGANEHEAEDIAHETIAAVLASSFEYRDARGAAAYLRTSARRCFIDQRRRGGVVIDAGDFEAGEDVWADYHERGAAHEQLAALERCMETLDERSRRALELQYDEGMEREAIADKLGVTFVNLKMILQRAKDSLRECMKRRMKGL